MYQVQARPTQICEEGDDETSNLANSVCIFSEPLLVGASLTQRYKANPGGSASIIAETLSPLELRLPTLQRAELGALSL
jgi:hypothetical protein